MKSQHDIDAAAALEVMKARCAADEGLMAACKWVWDMAHATIVDREPPGDAHDRNINNKGYKARAIYMIELASDKTPEDAARVALASVGIFT